MMVCKWSLALALALASACSAASSPAKNDYYFGLAARMIESNVQRGQGLNTTGKVSTFIELGVFQQALRAAIETTKDTAQAHKWTKYLKTSTYAPISLLNNATNDTGLPLDRFSTGSSLILSYRNHADPAVDATLTALQDSLVSQRRNQNGGLWYFANPAKPIAYANLSYLDGMYSYPRFATLLAPAYLAEDILHQINLLYHATRQPATGLLAHGYDAAKAHNWSNPITGASPIVWGRALAWYTVGILSALDTEGLPGHLDRGLRDIYVKVIEPQVRAYEVGKQQKTGRQVGVWQVVDRVGQEGNFVEASASFLTAWALLAGHRLGAFRGKEDLGKRAVQAGREIYGSATNLFLVTSTNGSVAINGTSSVASLGSGGTIDYKYYVTRPTELNSLFGTSAFILASLEMAQLAG